MSAAVPRKRNFKNGSSKFGQRTETGPPGDMDAPPVIDIARAAGTGLGLTGEHGMTPLMRAACDGLAGTVQALLDQGAEVNAARSDGFNALTLAAFWGHAQVVWLLLENGADLSATGRCETPPEMWADVKGFLDVGDLIRDARAAKQVEAQNLRTAVTDEPARFPRPAEQEKVQPDGNTGPVARDTVIDEPVDFQTSLPPGTGALGEQSTANGQLTGPPAPVLGTVTEEAIDSQLLSPMTPVASTEARPARRSDSSTKIVAPTNETRPQEPETEQQVPALKTLPEIQDPLPLVVPKFHPGSVFVARITPSQTTLVTLLLVLIVVGGGIAALLVPQIRESLPVGRSDTIQKPATLPKEPGNPVSSSSTDVSGTTENLPATTIETTAEPASRDTRLESTSQVESAGGAGSSSTEINATTGSEGHTTSTSVVDTGGSVAGTPGSNGRFSSPPSVSRSAAAPRRQRSRSSAMVKQETVLEEQPKPAPLSVEANRTRGEVSTPVRSANEAPRDQPPASVISGKPKSKVIQWP